MGESPLRWNIVMTDISTTNCPFLLVYAMIDNNISPMLLCTCLAAVVNCEYHFSSASLWEQIFVNFFWYASGKKHQPWTGMASPTTHLRWISTGKSLAAIFSLSPLSLALSASVILDIKFFVAVMQYWNHPRVLVSATGKSIIAVISVKMSACLVHQSISVSQCWPPCLKVVPFSACHTFCTHLISSYGFNGICCGI